MRILIVSDAWHPQVNGVVRTLEAVRGELERGGHAVGLLSPDQFRSIPCPTYPEIRLAMPAAGAVGARIAAFGADAIHIATEGPLGLAARRWCLRNGMAFTTAYHTSFPDYVAGRTGMPAAWFWRYIRWFHGPASAVLVSTAGVAATLAAHGIGHSRLWGRGVDLGLFRPDASPHPAFAALPRPIHLHVGRIAPEKNIEAFLALHLPGSKVVVGDGPMRAALAARHTDALFLGALSGEPLAGAYAGADVLVFPSRTDTFGLVMIEALASGIPVAAYPVPGPADVLRADVGCLDDDIGRAVAVALTLDRAACAAYGRGFSWAESARQFMNGLVVATEWRDAA